MKARFFNLIIIVLVFGIDSSLAGTGFAKLINKFSEMEILLNQKGYDIGEDILDRLDLLKESGDLEGGKFAPGLEDVDEKAFAAVDKTMPFVADAELEDVFPDPLNPTSSSGDSEVVNLVFTTGPFVDGPVAEAYVKFYLSRRVVQSAVPDEKIAAGIRALTKEIKRRNDPLNFGPLPATNNQHRERMPKFFTDDSGAPQSLGFDFTMNQHSYGRDNLLGDLGDLTSQKNVIFSSKYITDLMGGATGKIRPSGSVLEIKGAKKLERDLNQSVQVIGADDLSRNHINDSGLFSPSSDVGVEVEFEKVDYISNDFLVQDKNSINSLSNEVKNVELAKGFVGKLRNNELLSGNGRKTKFLVHTDFPEVARQGFLDKINLGVEELNKVLPPGGQFREFVDSDIIRDF